MENILYSLKDKILCDICNNYASFHNQAHFIYCKCPKGLYYNNTLITSFSYSYGLFIGTNYSFTSIIFENYYTHFNRYVNMFDNTNVIFDLNAISFSYLGENYKCDNLIECVLFANKLTKKTFENSIFI